MRNRKTKKQAAAQAARPAVAQSQAEYGSPRSCWRMRPCLPHETARFALGH